MEDNRRTVGDLLSESTMQLLVIDDQKRYIGDLCTLSDELVIEINRHQK
jgi:hypothetical protein